LRQALVVGEFALALALLTGAGLAIHSFWNLTQVDLGVKTEHIQTFYLPVPEERPKDPMLIGAYYRRMLEQIKALPGVTDASVSTGLPLYGAGFGMPFTIAGAPEIKDPSQRPGAAFGMVTPDYFKTFGIQVLRGRSFTDQDALGGLRVAMVSESFVQKYFKDKDPLQQRLMVEELIPGVTKLGAPLPWQIVGVFHDVRGNGLREGRPEIEIPFWQIPWPTANFGVRTFGDPKTMTRSIEDAVHSVDPEIALAELHTMDEIKSDVMSGDRFTMVLYGCFAMVALSLAAVGIYGVMAFTVSQRGHEIGLRMALGASRGNVVRLILREGLSLALAGLGLGLIGAYFVGRAMQSSLYGVGSLDATAIVAVAVVLFNAALLASWLPAQRAASIQPMQALREQ
jgi:predicted permease